MYILCHQKHMVRLSQKVDDKVYLQNALGQPFVARVAALTDDEITFDANHEMAGKELNFKIELVEVQ